MKSTLEDVLDSLSNQFPFFPIGEKIKIILASICQEDLDVSFEKIYAFADLIETPVDLKDLEENPGIAIKHKKTNDAVFIQQFGDTIRCSFVRNYGPMANDSWREKSKNETYVKNKIIDFFR
jgi:hypothetical protein